MPDLSHEASLKYWHDFLDPMIYRVITFMESVESFTQDGEQELEQAMQSLGVTLDNIQSIDISALGAEEQFVQIAGQIKTGRGLRLLQAIDTVHPGSASKVLIHAEETSLSPDDQASFFLKRNIVFERLRLLSRVFSKQRLSLVAQGLEGEE